MPCQPSRREICSAADLTSTITPGNRSSPKRKVGPEALTDAITSPSLPMIGAATAVNPSSSSSTATA